MTRERRPTVDINACVRASTKLRALNEDQKTARRAFIAEAMRNAEELDRARAEIRRLRRRLEEARQCAPVDVPGETGIQL